MHHSQNAPHFSFPRQDHFKNLAGPACILIRARDIMEAPAEQICQFRTQFQTVFLRQLERTNHLLGIPAKKVASNRIQLFLANEK